MDKIRQAIEQARTERERSAPNQHDIPATSSAPAHPLRRAAVPFEPNAERLADALILPANDAGEAARAIRLLRTIVLQRMHEHGWRTLGIVAAHHADGKSTLAGNLAVAIATDPRCSAVLVDLDVSAPWVSRTFGAPNSDGLAACLLGETDLEHCTFAPTGVGRLEIVTLAPEGAAVDPAIVALPSLAVTLGRLKEREDSIVIVDLPAVLDSDAALTAATLCDCLIFAVKEGRTTRADLERGLGLLAAVPVLGTVLMDSLTAPVGETVRT